MADREYGPPVLCMAAINVTGPPLQHTVPPPYCHACTTKLFE